MSWFKVSQQKTLYLSTVLTIRVRLYICLEPILYTVNVHYKLENRAIS